MLPDGVQFPVLSHRHSPNPPRHKLPVCGRWSQVLAPHLESRKDTRRVLPVVSLPGEFLCVTYPISVQSSRPAKAVYYRETFTTIALFMSSLVTIYTMMRLSQHCFVSLWPAGCGTRSSETGRVHNRLFHGMISKTVAARQAPPRRGQCKAITLATKTPQGVQRSGKSQGNSRLGKSQGKVREFCWRSGKKWMLGKVREFAFSAI